MDVLERLNRRFGAWYEGLFGGGADAELRPRDVLRRLVAALEDARREGLDGQVYVPNQCTLRIAVEDDEERQYLRAFLDADELAGAVAERIAQHGYKTRGPLLFSIEEVDAAADTPKLQILCRYETAPSPPAPATLSEDPGTVPAVGAALARLTLIGVDGRVEEFALGMSGVRIGRGRQAGNDILLAGDTMASKRHARIAYENGRFVLYDEESTNGTTVDGENVPAGRPFSLHDGDEIRIGQTRLTLHIAHESATAPAPRGATGGLVLVGPQGERYPLASRMLVGRALIDDIVLVGEGVSAQHAIVALSGAAATVEDLDTPGGTQVNGERIPPRFPVVVHPGDTIAFGQVTLRLAAGGGSR